MHRAGIEPATQ